MISGTTEESLVTRIESLLDESQRTTDLDLKWTATSSYPVQQAPKADDREPSSRVADVSLTSQLCEVTPLHPPSAKRPEQPRPEEPEPRTPLGKRLLALRRKAIEGGMRLLDQDEVLEEIRRRRGEVDSDDSDVS
jgi:hypothetical protein